MARIHNNGSRSVKTSKPAPKPEKKPAQKAAPKSEKKPAEKPADRFVSERDTKNFASGRRGDINRLATSDKANVTTNRDGSVTSARASTSGRTSRTEELTTDKGLLGDSKLKYTTTSKTGNQEVKNTFTSQTDVLRRSQSTHTRETTKTKGDTTTTDSRTTATGTWGTQKQTETNSVKVTTGDNSKTDSKAVTTDRYGNRATTHSTATAEKNGNTTTTRTNKNTTGTELNTSSTMKYEEGKLTIGEQADWKNNRFSTEKSYSRETELRPSSEDKGFSQTQKSDRLSQAQTAGNLLGAAGAKVELTKGEIPKDRMHENNLLGNDPNNPHFVGTRHGVSGSHEVTIGADGVNASFKREAKAGLYAETKGDNYAASAKAEARAAVDAKGKLDLNGLDASVNAKASIGVEASATLKGEKTVGQIAGVDVKVGAEGTVKASAEAALEATGKAKITRNPPTAILEGTVGASAVAKIEGEVKASAGPFSVKANVYGSAGAEAKATGAIGYEDGKLKLSGSLGAAVGLGAGGGATVEVDVKQIGDMAKNTAVKVADVNGDGKLGVDDAKAVVNEAKAVVSNTVNEAKAAVSNTVNAAKSTVNEAKNKVLKFFGW